MADVGRIGMGLGYYGKIKPDYVSQEEANPHIIYVREVNEFFDNFEAEVV